MTGTQKIIKGIAVALAIFLAVTIISMIIGGLEAILGAFGVFKRSNEDLLENLTTISDEVEKISSINIELNASELQIKNGEKFKVETNNSKVTYSNNDGVITLKDNSNVKWHYKNNNIGSVIVYLPKEMETLEETKIETGIGKISVEILNTEKLYFNLGAGAVEVENLIVSKDAKINGGAGEINISNSKLNNLDLDLGVGEANFSGNITGKSKIDTGIGEFNLKLSLPESEYKFDISKGIGEVKLNDKKIPNDYTVGEGSNYIDIDCGIGEVNIKTSEM